VNRRALAAVFFFLLRARSFALELPEWTAGFFLDLEGQYYIIPDFTGTLDAPVAERYGVAGGLVKPYPGFRLGAGYGWSRFRLSLESGYTYIAGTNPLVLDIHLVPLVLRAGYTFRLGKFSVLPSIGAGLIFSSVTHYETAIAMLLDKLSRSSGGGVLVNAGLRLGWALTPGVGLYAGAGIDCVVERDGLLPLPVVEMGISLKPFLLGKRRPARTPEVPAGPEISSGPAVPEAAAEAGIAGVVYFPADSAVPAAPPAELDAAGELLRASPALGVRLRGYAAPYGSPAWLSGLSEERARFCGDYLVKEYGIERERISVEWYGEGQSETGVSDQEWRRVEIIIENREAPIING
jgi:hypothetical protein